MDVKERLAPARRNELENVEDADGKVAGFWRGLWHGMIAPLMVLVSLFREDVGIYETHNSGKGYNFGFLLGLMMVFGGNKGGGMTGFGKQGVGRGVGPGTTRPPAVVVSPPRASGGRQPFPRQRWSSALPAPAAEAAGYPEEAG